jgi:hypothetical protein
MPSTFNGAESLAQEILTHHVVLKQLRTAITYLAMSFIVALIVDLLRCDLKLWNLPWLSSFAIDGASQNYPGASKCQLTR